MLLLGDGVRRTIVVADNGYDRRLVVFHRDKHFRLNGLDSLGNPGKEQPIGAGFGDHVYII